MESLNIEDKEKTVKEEVPLFVYVHEVSQVLLEQMKGLQDSITFSLIEKYLLLSPKNQKVATTYIQNRNMIRLHKNNKDKTYTDNKYKTYMTINVYSGLLQ